MNSNGRSTKERLYIVSSILSYTSTLWSPTRSTIGVLVRSFREGSSIDVVRYDDFLRICGCKGYQGVAWLRSLSQHSV